MLSELLKSTLTLIDNIFPRKCIICRKLSSLKVCSNCLPKKIQITTFGAGLFYLYNYADSVKELIHVFKLDKDKSVAKLFRESLELELFSDYDLVIPVPCHWFRVISRGFFHLKELFGSVPGYQGGLVKRVRYTGVLYKKGRKEREKTMKDVFSVTDPSAIQGKSILIVDDIFTTGTTYKEIKKELEKYSPAKVEGLFLCRA